MTILRRRTATAVAVLAATLGAMAVGTGTASANPCSLPKSSTEYRVKCLGDVSGSRFDSLVNRLNNGPAIELEVLADPYVAPTSPYPPAGVQIVPSTPVIVGSSVTGTTPSGDPVAKPLTENCQRGLFIHDISVLEWPDGSLKVSISPMESVQRGGAIANLGNAAEVTAGADAGLRSCVAELGGLDATESLSIHQQLDCHVQLEAGFFLASSGPTWDLESWRVPLEPGDTTGYARSECLNTR